MGIVEHHDRSPRPGTDALPRILFIDHCAQMSGGEIALLNLVRALDSTRYHPVVLLCSDGPLLKALTSTGVDTHLLPLDDTVASARKDTIGPSTFTNLNKMWKSAAYVFRLARFMREQEIALVHTNSLKADILGGLAARAAGLPLVWHIRDRIADDYLPPTVAAAFRWLAGVIPHVVIANSASTLASMNRKPDARSAIVYSGVRTCDLNKAGDREPTRVLRSGSAAAGTDAPIIGLLGRISLWKGQDVFLRAAAIVLRRFPRARFRIIGKAMFDEALYERQLHELVKSLGIAPSVEFAGFRSDVSAALAELDLLVHASTTGEPFGQSIVEGMAGGLPVVATDGGGVPEIVVHGITGLLVAMKDVDAMAAAMIRILSDPAAARAMARNGRRRAHDRFSIQKTARAVEAIYDRLLRERA